jgi:putative DNA-invertase from lambdoid prophage Rac
LRDRLTTGDLEPEVFHELALPFDATSYSGRLSVVLLDQAKKMLFRAYRGRGVSTGKCKLFLTIAAAFAEAERDRIRERIGQVKADQRARGQYLGGDVPFGFRRGDDGELVPHEAEQEALREIAALRAQGLSLRAIRDEMRAKGFQISHEGVARILRGRRAA